MVAAGPQGTEKHTLPAGRGRSVNSDTPASGVTQRKSPARHCFILASLLLLIGCAQPANSQKPAKPKPSVVQYGDFGAGMAAWVESGDCDHTDKLLTVGDKVLAKRELKPDTFDDAFADLRKKGQRVTPELAKDLAGRLRGLK